MQETTDYWLLTTEQKEYLMPENEETKEPQEPQENPGPRKSLDTDNGAANSEGLEAINAELEEEKKAKAAAEAALAEKDALIADLQAQLSEAKKGSEATAAELATVKATHAQAVSKYLEAARALNSTIPKDIIAGGTIEEIDASVQKALSIAESVKKTLEAQAKEAKVPAGAPTRGEISLEGLSPREKIAAGIHQKGGTS
jgi:chromosome segregation ATPase